MTQQQMPTNRMPTIYNCQIGSGSFETAQQSTGIWRRGKGKLSEVNCITARRREKLGRERDRKHGRERDRYPSVLLHCSLLKATHSK
jgi:hypothetical protein